MRFFATRRIIGARTKGYQIDYRPDGWLPLSVRTGKRKWHIIRLGRLGVLTLGKIGEIR